MTSITAKIEHMRQRVADLPLKDGERTEFLAYFERYLSPSADQDFEWERIAAPPSSLMVPYEDLPKATETPADLLRQVCVLKLNGGLGTSMGCTGPKSLLPVRGTRTFLDLTLAQIAALRAETGVHVPLVLMNSYNTDSATKAALAAVSAGADKAVAATAADTICFEQSRFPRIDAETDRTLEEMVSDLSPDSDAAYAPPGHGNLLMAIVTTGTAQKLLDRGIKYAFVSNCDNLGATLDVQILGNVVRNGLEFCSEYTPKTHADVKGGTLVTYEGKDGRSTLRLLERAQVPAGHEDDFCDIKKFTVFNTNTLYIDLEALMRLTDGGKTAPRLDLIVNRKHVAGRDCVQLETAVGTAISLFEKAGAVVVPRTRFLPVKTTSDLFLVRSDLFVEQNGALYRSELAAEQRADAAAKVSALPLIKLSPDYVLMDDFTRLVPRVPSLRNVENLTVAKAYVFSGTEKLSGKASLP